MPAMDKMAGIQTQGGGTWMQALLQSLAKMPGVKLGVVCAYTGRASAQFEADGIDYFVIGQPRWCDLGNPKDLTACAAVVEQWKPDLIHIHGTERFYGLLAGCLKTPCPIVISIQGLINPYSKWPAFFGNLSITEIARTITWRDLAFQNGLVFDYQRYKSKALQEKVIINQNRNFIGRTAWDRAWLTQMNPKAKYFHGGEMLRSEFFGASWEIGKCRRHSLMSTNIGHPRRGTEVLLAAVAQLAERYPDIELKMAGSLNPKAGYGRFLMNRINDLGLRSRVKLLGYQDAKSLAKELYEAHLFVHASYMDNSPNSLCEAMLAGLPCVASYTGGIPSMLADGKEGLFFPVGDSASLAASITGIFENDLLAVELGSQARLRALRRHDPQTILNQLLETYNAVVSEARPNSASLSNPA